MADVPVTWETAAVIVTVVGSTFSMTTWLNNQFTKRDRVSDQRHRQNLVRFTRIFTHMGIYDLHDDEDDDNGRH